MRRQPAVLAAILLTLASVTPSLAAWPNLPAVNVPLCNTSVTPPGAFMVPDGAGGAIVAWSDYRSGTNADIYAQHVTVSGSVDPAWPVNGRAVCTAANDQVNLRIVADGVGGAVLAWQDLRGGATNDIYAQHVLANGAVDPAWPAGGRAVCAAVNNQYSPAIATDGAGGAIVTWYDLRSGPNADIYAQHVLANGSVDPAWPADGRVVCTAVLDQMVPVIVADGSGGAIVAWEDYRNGAGTMDVYAQHVLAGGTVDPGWPADGRGVCTVTSYQSALAMVSDGAGGGIIAWEDFRSGTNYDIYVGHVTAIGMADPAWPAGGRALCTAVNHQIGPTIVSDDGGGAIVAWEDTRSGAGYDVYAGHILANGAADPTLPADGIVICAATQNQTNPVALADGSGGAIIAWQDYRGGTYSDVYAQHLLINSYGGFADPAWPADGRCVANASDDQIYPRLVTDGAGGAIVAWGDARDGSGTSHEYAQRVARFGYLGTPEPQITGVKDVPADNGGKVKLSWTASYLDVNNDYNLTVYDVLRSVATYAVPAARARGARPLSALGTAGSQMPGDLFVVPAAGQAYYWEFLVTVNALHYVTGYSYLAPTVQDSGVAGALKTAFMVVGRSGQSTTYWPSRPDSGYSVDNLPPYPPAPFAGTYSAGAATLHWGANTEPDLAGYRLYCGTTAGYVPGAASLVTATTDTAYIDASPGTAYYKLTAIDVHGNESAATSLLPAGSLDVNGELPAVLAFAPPEPSPARRATRLRFTLPAPGHVRLAVYDPGGRRVRVLVDASFAAGEGSATWELNDEGGGRVGAGLYFARLEAGGRTIVRRVLALR